MGRATRNAMKAGFMIGLMVWFLAGGFFVVTGTGLMFSQGWMGGILLIPGGLLITIGVMRLRKWQGEQQSEINIPEISAVRDDEKILFHWHVPAPEWKEFAKLETREALKTTVAILIVFPALGVGGWMLIQNSLFLVLIFAATVLLVLISLWGVASRRELLKSAPEVIFKSSGMILGGQVILYRNEIAWPGAVEIKDWKGSPVLVIRFERFSISRYSTGRRLPSKTVRVPIPPDKMEEAKLVKELILAMRR